MEVHKHPHHVTHKKKWTEYLLEFFMLFLAVFLGFVAENTRENIVERKREKHYMHSMVEDLQKDTAILNKIINRAGLITNLLDTAERILFIEKLNDSLIKKLYSFNLNMLPSIQTTFTDRTTSQLKNAGGLHLIRNAIVVENLFDYWTFTEEIQHNSENYNELRIHAREKSYSIFSAKDYSPVPENNNFSTEVTPKLMTTDRSVLEEFANRLGHLKNGNQFVYIPNLKAAFAAAVKLMALIKTEYHLQNE
ncbi:MAG TPA: hypothetical protein VMY77_08205 [Chitinophagaceae bacterium]|nr:hypothetical protein [Chitinophagaceae bacterium]